MEVLLEKGAEMDAVALNGGTPLTRAIESSRIHVVQYLIQRGSKIQTENKKGDHNTASLILFHISAVRNYSSLNQINSAFGLWQIVWLNAGHNDFLDNGP